MQETRHDADSAAPSKSINYEIDAIKSFHKSLAATMKTPFLHPRLYEDDIPSCILDAFSASMLYLNKNEANEAAVLMVLDAYAMRLLERGPLFESRNPRDLLAHVQALLIYQTIRIFDVSIRHRARADAAMGTLRDWTVQLEQERNRLDASLNVGPDAPSWDVSDTSDALRAVTLT